MPNITNTLPTSGYVQEGHEIRGIARAGEWYKIAIEKVANGFVISVGCKTFVAKTWDEAAKGLAEYWKDPEAAEKKYAR